jgi:hypothetical protein
MLFNSHSNLAGKHAFLSASKYSWIRYDDEKLEQTFLNALAAVRGTRLHELASMAISLGVKMPRTSTTLNDYVNDAIGYRMTPEQVLFFSDNFFGTADAISFRKNLLRIHDLKNGIKPCSFDQLLIYVALFCLEYDIKPTDIKIELRIYQNDEIQVLEPDPHDIIEIIDKMVKFDTRLNDLKREALE